MFPDSGQTQLSSASKRNNEDTGCKFSCQSGVDQTSLLSLSSLVLCHLLSCKQTYVIRDFDQLHVEIAVTVAIGHLLGPEPNSCLRQSSGSQAHCLSICTCLVVPTTLWPKNRKHKCPLDSLYGSTSPVGTYVWFAL